MINELSILIPCYNGRCKELVESLHSLLRKENSTTGLRYEIIVADDGSTDNDVIEHNRQIDSLDNCRYIIRKKNVGRAAIRNFLAREAKYEWLLFIDCDMIVRDNGYIAKYIHSQESSIIYGGYSVKGDKEKLKGNLRFIYEKKCEANHTCSERKKQPYKDFHPSNFMVRRDIILEHPLDERFRYYGYEDVLWGKTLKNNSIDINHIDNPLSFEKFEDNASFIFKTEEGLATLYRFRKDLEGYSNLIEYAKRLHRFHLTPLAALIHNILSGSIKYNLTGNNPSLLLFNIYKVCFFCNLSNRSSL